MIGSLVRDRYRPPVGTRLWFKYWAKRVRLLGSLIATELSMRRYARRCLSLGSRTVISRSKIGGQLERLAIGSDCAIGRVQIALHDHVTIGDCVVINDGCQLFTGTHNIHSRTLELLAKPIVIEDYVWIATGAMILPGVTIGRGAVVGAGAVVAKSVEPRIVVAGNPARPVGRRRENDFCYRPSRFMALFEAWLGPVELSLCNDRPSSPDHIGTQLRDADS
jgi:acetyltransferase-like isoleucine patch superfamily enzyme